MRRCAICKAEESIKTLEYKGYRHDEVLNYWKNVDVWIDRFYTGFYGWSAIEAASCGIPVMCQIEEQVRQHVADCPFLQMKDTVDSIRSNLEYLICSSDREALGKKHRKYAVEKHDSEKVAEKCISEYSKIR